MIAPHGPFHAAPPPTSVALAALAPKADPVFTGQARLPDGTAATPALTATADTDTGLLFPEADALALTAGGIERLRLAGGGVSIGAAPGGESLRVLPAAGATAWLTVSGSAGGSPTVATSAGGLELAPAAGRVSIPSGSTGAPGIGPVGDPDTGLFAPAADALAIGAGGTERLRAAADGVSLAGAPGADSVRVQAVANAVNRWEFYGAAAGSPPYAAAQGTDAGIGFRWLTKGAGNHDFLTGTSLTNLQFRIGHTDGAANAVQVTGGAAGTGPTLSAIGSDANVSIRLAPKGTGLVWLASGGIRFPDGSTQTTAPAGGGGMANPMTADGDILVGGPGGTPARLAIGVNGGVLRSNGTTAYWDGPAAGAYAWWTAGERVNTAVADVWLDMVAGYVLSQATSGSRPTLTVSGGVTCLDFDGTDDTLLSATLSSHDPDGLTAMTVQMLVSVDFADDGVTDPPTFPAIWWGETGSWGTVFLSPRQNRLRWRFGTGQSGNSPSQPFTSQTTNWYVATIVKNGAAEAVYVNATQLYTASTFNATIANNENRFAVGSKSGASFWNGRIAEILIYKSALSAAQVASNVAFLARRHSITLP